MFVSIHEKNATGEKLGSKAYALNRLRTEGFFVPDGFLMDTDVYDAFLSWNHLQETVADNLRVLRKDNARAVSEAIREAFSQATLPKRVAIELKERALEGVSYAVFGSNQIEEIERASLTDGIDVFEDVSASDLAGRIIACYQSMFSEKVLHYLIDHAVDTKDLKMTVIVQEMVASVKSGTCYTVNPETGNDKEMLIEVCAGGGSDPAGSKTRPEQYAYNWFEKIPMNMAKGQSLFTREALTAYAETFAAIQQFLGYPLEILYAIAQDHLFIRQVRCVRGIRYSGIGEQWTTAGLTDGGISEMTCTPYRWSLFEYAWEYAMRDFITLAKLLKEEELPDKFGEMFFGRGYWNLSAVKRALGRIVGFRESVFDDDYGIPREYEGDGQVTSLVPRTAAAMGVITLRLQQMAREQKGSGADCKERLTDTCEQYQKRYNGGTIPDIKEQFLKLTRQDSFRAEVIFFQQIFFNAAQRTIHRDSLLKVVSETELRTLICAEEAGDEKGTEDQTAYEAALASIRSKAGSKADKLIARAEAMRAMESRKEELSAISAQFKTVVEDYTMAYARRLVKDGVLDREEDIRYVKVANLWDFIEGRMSAEQLRTILNKNRIYYRAYRNYISDNIIGNRLTAH